MSERVLLTLHFIECRARSGGVIHALLGIVNVEKSTFEKNDAVDGTGGAMQFDSSRISIGDTELSSNNARNYAGIHVLNSTRMNATNISIHSNVARESGGGMGLESGSSLLCRGCQFIKNEAKQGGGMTIWANESMPIVAQLQDSTFANNTASAYGGEILLYFLRYACVCFLQVDCSLYISSRTPLVATLPKLLAAAFFC